MPTLREVAQGLQYQGVDEIIPYTLTTTNWASAPTTVTVKAYDLTTGNTDVTSTVLSGSATTAGDVITLPALQSLTANHRYRVDVKFVVGTATYEAYINVQAED